MSGRYKVSRNLAGRDFSGTTHADRVQLLKMLLESGIHGISFSPYLEGQEPGVQIEAAQIEERMNIIKPCADWIRTFSCMEGNQQTPVIADRHGLKTMVGVCISDDLERNELELANGIELARDGYADILAIGNEVLLREELTEQELIDYILRARQAVPGVPVSYVDAYYQFEDHPALTDVCDVLLINCYPFWEGCPVEYALLYMKDMYRRAVSVAAGKKVIISETGWPSSGEPNGPAMPSLDNAVRYFINTYQWAEQEDIEIFYFSSFDEAWKTGDEGGVGAFWGLWDQYGSLKYE